MGVQDGQSRQYAVGVDVGATKIASALVDDAGVILATRQTLTGAADGPDAVVARIAADINALIAQSPAQPAGIGIGTPGEHLPEQGVVHYAVNLGWVDLPLARLVSQRVGDGLPVWTQNDTNVAALGEYFFGSAQSSPNFVYIGVGSGIGSGIVLDGKILNGATNNSGEIGHLSLDPDNGLLCECGLHGCVETVVSGTGLVKSARAWLEQGRYPSRLTAGPNLDPYAILQAARDGDPLAVALFQYAARWLGATLAVFISTVNPEKFIIGGGLGHAAYDLLVPGAQEELGRRVLPSPRQHLQIAASQVHSSAIGASCLVWQNQSRR